MSIVSRHKMAELKRFFLIREGIVDISIEKDYTNAKRIISRALRGIRLGQDSSIGY